MVRNVLAISMLALLAACGEGTNPIDGGAGGGGGGGGGVTPPPTDNPVPATFARNLNAASYNAAADTLAVDIAFDASNFIANYTRRPDLDVPGYEAYLVEESPNRTFIGLFRENPRGNLVAGAVADNGFATTALGGTTYYRIDTYSLPSSGLALYRGSYAGALASGGALPNRTTGDVNFEADFVSGQVNGEVTNRSIVGGPALDDVNMVITAISNTGEFSGGTRFDDLTANGNYGGLFGGTNASDVAGVLVFNPISGSPVFEYGSFNIARCGTAGDDPSCP